MTDNLVSGACINRALSHLMKINDVLSVYYTNTLDPDKFYSRDERMKIMENFLTKMNLTEKYTPRCVEAAIENETRRRDRSPVPRDYFTRPPQNPGSFILTDVPKVVGDNFSGKVYLIFLECIEDPPKIEELEKKRILVPDRNYDKQVLHKAAAFLRNELFDGPTLVKAFQYFIEIPDIKSLIGHDAQIDPLPSAKDHNYTLMTKVSRVRDEIILAQKHIPPYVSKFFDLVFERYFEDHYALECVYFDKRMVLLDRLPQMPTGTKGKGVVKNELVKINEDDRYELDIKVLSEAHPFLRERMGSKLGKEFIEAFLQHMQTTFPGRANGKPPRSALYFAERFFLWAAETLEFEKHLVEPYKSMYTFHTCVPFKMFCCRVVHLPSSINGEFSAFIMMDDILNTLRIYESIYGPLDVKIRAPDRPGPPPTYMHFVKADKYEDELRKKTNNKIVFEMMSLTHVQISGMSLFPIPGPFNRLCTTPASILDVVLIALVDKLRLGVLLDPKHPEVVKYGMNLASHFPTVNNFVLVDLQVLRELKKDTFALKQYQSEHSPKATELLNEQLQLYQWVADNKAVQPEQLKMTFRRIVLVKAFPWIAEMMHSMFCTGNMCYYSFLPDFKSYFGPWPRDMDQKFYEIKCNALHERLEPDDNLFDRLKEAAPL